jgi:hypothetical protein
VALPTDSNNCDFVDETDKGEALTPEEVMNAEHELAALNIEITRWEQDRDPDSISHLNESLSPRAHLP